MPDDPKAALRRAARLIRGRAADPAGAEQAAQHLPLESLAPVEVVAGYHPQGSEMDPRPVLARLAEAGARIAYPAAAQRDAAFAFRLHDPHIALIPDAYGVPSPPPSAPQVDPDIVIAPLLAFDRRGGRLGQGGGVYDRTLAALRARKPVLVIGLAYAAQEIAEVPMGPHDERLDAILTETGYIAVG